MRATGYDIYHKEEALQWDVVAPLRRVIEERTVTEPGLDQGNCGALSPLIPSLENIELISRNLCMRGPFCVLKTSFYPARYGLHFPYCKNKLPTAVI
jgi:hypothetical protein